MASQINKLIAPVFIGLLVLLFLKKGGLPGLPNPASVYCENCGYTLQIREDEFGNQYGVCIFPDSSECEEWAFYREECGQEWRC